MFSHTEIELARKVLETKGKDPGLPVYSQGPLGDRPGEKFVYLRDLTGLLARLELRLHQEEKSLAAIDAYKLLRESLEEIL